MKEHIINLKVISKLKPHMRLDTSTTYFKVYSSEAWFGEWAIRWWSAHNRKKDIACVTQLYEECLKYIESNAKEEKSYEQVIKQVKLALKNSLDGLENLKVTYEDDLTCVSSLEYIIECVNTNIPGHQRTHD
jgi:hypothetical protein